MKNYIKIYLDEILLFRPRICSTILFIPFLYIVGWFLAQPLLLFNFEIENLSLIGTIFTFLIFIYLIPYWFNIRWNIKNIWEVLGITTNNLMRNIFYIIKGTLFSLILIALILIPIFMGNYITWIGEFKTTIFLNAFLLGVFIGFAEEIIFRAWFLEELKLQYGIKIAVVTQAIIFSFVHPVNNTFFWNILGLRLGLFLLGIFLSLVRLKNKGSLWESIGIHGGLVGIWFFINNGLLKITDNAPSFLSGPFDQNVPNPLGSFCAIMILMVLCLTLRKNQ